MLLHDINLRLECKLLVEVRVSQMVSRWTINWCAWVNFFLKGEPKVVYWGSLNFNLKFDNSHAWAIESRMLLEQEKRLIVIISPIKICIGVRFNITET